MKDSLMKQCLDILKTEDVRNEIKVIFSPVTDLILYEIYPYIYIIIFLVILIFILILAILVILIILLRNKSFIKSIIDKKNYGWKNTLIFITPFFFRGITIKIYSFLINFRSNFAN